MPQQKVVAARQQWRCSECSSLLPAAFQVDHTVPLWKGGPNTIANATAMCASCHASKTQLEAIERAAAAEAAAVDLAAAYNNRTDYYRLGTLTCEFCHQQRPAGVEHTRCRVLDAQRPEAQRAAQALTASALARFRFVRRVPSAG